MLILIRHGQSTANDAGLLVGRTDTPLTQRGREQASALSELLTHVEQVVVSPLARARETAALALPHASALIDEAFIEVDYGQLESTPLGDVGRANWELFQNDHDFVMGGGESLAHVDARVQSRLEEWLRDEESLLHHPSRHVAVVSHVSPIKSAVAWALGAPGNVVWRMRLDNASTTTIGARQGRPFLVTYNEVTPRYRAGVEVGRTVG
ncbi:MAG: histidine phosphatase family protein [Actinomycetota bacterium]